MSNDTLLDLDSLLDADLSAIENLPNYVTPPNGLYTLAVPEVKLETFTKKGKNNEPDLPNQVRIRLTYQVISVDEMDNPEKDVAVAEGSMFSDTFMYADKGQAFFKRQASQLLNVPTEELSPLSLRDIFTELQSIEAVTAVVMTKDNNGYENTSVRPFHQS